ncbi:AAA family ATPase [Mycolicibacterium fortuitum]|uniref:AAA family ATPase n=3 Tax=Mycolicibacterium fortuitum TaxID=1766 RepID=A0A378UWL3_MYCFO|nr:AAA family ATPase [Mycolicibacterium fortuitum]CRL55264.1 vesicle-fusing ATPase [Mycolicibacterium fortuitum subsp. fortuitum DSM 46621 = ATCC 6841 = JCM 6387]MCV7140968.1 AAA family ATPase [Mycolicibacterium fortuitum]MDV7192773.1 AAA family ATPase [Mycolicibacterium fortuitum]MDV7205699.1 AAA family ATPase [Mycolicibacterium fortuitum]MDV7229333.1 AAA family ATPase [Mycolicibacterium fortuitum]
MSQLEIDEEPSLGHLRLTARLNTSALDSRRGVVRLHPEAIAALGIREWDAVSLTGSRTTAAVVGIAPGGTPTGTALLDDVTLSNAGVRENAMVIVAPVTVYGARAVTVTGSKLATDSISSATLRQALLGKVMTVGDTVSLLPRDLGPGTSTSAATSALASSVGITWTSELLTVTGVDPAGPVSIQPNSVVSWGSGLEPSTSDSTGAHTISPARTEPAVSFDDLKGSHTQAGKLTEWLKLSLDEPQLLETLGATPNLGVLVSGPAGVGKATMVRTVCAERRLVELDGPEVGALAADDRFSRVSDAVATVRDGGGVLLISDVDALLPAAAADRTPEPVAALIIGELREAVATRGVAFIATSAVPVGVDPRLRAPDLCDRELALTLPDGATRKALLEVLLRGVPCAELNLGEIADRTPGFVVADLAALVREGALRAASRASADGTEPVLWQEDLTGALTVIRPLSRSAAEEVSVGSVTLDDVGDMVETKQALTEAVLWPLQHPDTFQRLGVEPPRGVLLYGPPGCGKTFLVRALASSGKLSVHAVKGAELMDKWVGSSEKAVRELFARARDSAPSLVFLDEIDALAPRRGQSFDSGVTDRVVASLLTELDGIEPMNDVVVLGATNRPDLIDPALLRPGRLEKLVFVEPPDADARREILRTSGKSIPLAADVDLDALASELDGYSAADCVALLREAALTAMRRSIDAADVTAADVAKARETVRPSLDAAQVQSLREFAAGR